MGPHGLAVGRRAASRQSGDERTQPFQPLANIRTTEKPEQADEQIVGMVRKESSG